VEVVVALDCAGVFCQMAIKCRWLGKTGEMAMPAAQESTPSTPSTSSAPGAPSTPTASSAITVLLADDHPIVMTGFAMSLTHLGMRVLGQAKTPQEAVEQYRALHPDVLILDMRFGSEMTGMDVAKQVLQFDSRAKIIFLSQFDQDSLIKETYRIGAHAFVTKDCDPADLALAVTRAHAGELYFPPHIAERLANLSVRGDASPQSLLDERSLQIFKLMAEGLTNAEIAEQLDLSTKTISNVSQEIKEKLGIQRPALITKLALKYGLIAP
jgi:two-component system invasion response regulator UvrY